MALYQSDKKPQPGDLVEIYRGSYQHWGIYVGDGYIIHLAPPSETAQAGAYSMMSVLHDKAVVKKEQLWEVTGRDKYRVNNLLDDKYKPRSVRAILEEAHSLVGVEMSYCVFSQNCEHFVTELRYGKSESRQVRTAVAAGAAAAIGLGVVALVAAFLKSGNKEKEETQ